MIFLKIENRLKFSANKREEIFCNYHNKEDEEESINFNLQ